MAKRKRDRKLQKNLQINNATVAPPPYDIVSHESNTEDFLKHKSNKNKNLCTDANLCQCHDSYQPKTWQSITNLCGDEDTTEVWQSKEPVTLFNQSKQGKTNKKDKNKHTKKSKGIFYKHTDKRKQNPLQNDSGKDEQPTIEFNVKKKQKSKKKEPLTHPHGTGEPCAGGPCTINLADVYSPQKKGAKDVKKKTKVNKTNINVNKNDNMEGQGDRTVPSAEERTGSKSHFLDSPCNFISKLKNFASIHRVNSKVPKNPIKTEPMFEMKVNSEEMRVLNPREVQMNVKKFGTLEKKQCICPSRLSASKNVCRRGICERALTQKNGRFKCNCGKRHTIECEDTTCNSKNKSYKEYKGKSSNNQNQNNPLLEVRVDSNMTVLNSDEIKNILSDANNKVCPTGICRVAAKKHMNLNCKCLNKKITPKAMECTRHTCQSHRKCKVSNLCSRIFSNSDNFVDNYQRNPQSRTKKISRAPNEFRGRQHHGNNKDQGDFYKCYCECDVKHAPERKTPHGTKKKKECCFKNIKQRRRERRQQEEAVTFTQYIMKCLQRRRKRCEKQIKEKEEQFKKNEKELQKLHLKEMKLQEKAKKEDEHSWNCLANFLSGFLNLLVKSVKNIFSAFFSLIFNPIGSYVYIRERAKDPPGTLGKIGLWIVRTWSNKTSKMSQTVKDSHTISVLADQIESLPVYETLIANKGRTPKEKAIFEKKKRMREKRIRKRHEEALYGCRHMILTTMRKTPCLWFYHICPDMYPQCLSLITFVRNFFHLIIYLVAFMCWTPCIISFELCRACLCCILCNG